MFNTTHGQEPNAAIPVCYSSDEPPTNGTYVHVSERRRRHLEHPDLPLSQRQMTTCRIVTPFCNGRNLWGSSLREWFCCCFSEEQLITLATEAIGIAGGMGWVQYAETAIDHFHGAMSKARGFIPDAMPEAFAAVAQALRGKIGEPLPLGELIVYTTDGIQWQTGSSLSRSRYYATKLFSIFPDGIETDSEQRITGYRWGAGIVTASDTVATWEGFVKSFDW